ITRRQIVQRREGHALLRLHVELRKVGRRRCELSEDAAVGSRLLSYDEPTSIAQRARHDPYGIRFREGRTTDRHFARPARQRGGGLVQHQHRRTLAYERTGFRYLQEHSPITALSTSALATSPQKRSQIGRSGGPIIRSCLAEAGWSRGCVQNRADARIKLAGAGRDD